MKKGKRYVESAKLVDRTNLYDVDEAVSILKKTASAKFDETVEAHILSLIHIFIWMMEIMKHMSIPKMNIKGFRGRSFGCALL